MEANICFNQETSSLAEWTTLSSAWSLSDTCADSRTIRHADTDNDLVWERGIWHSDAQRVDMIEGPRIVLVPKGQVDDIPIPSSITFGGMSA